MPVPVPSPAFLQASFAAPDRFPQGQVSLHLILPSAGGLTIQSEESMKARIENNLKQLIPVSLRDRLRGNNVSEVTRSEWTVSSGLFNPRVGDPPAALGMKFSKEVFSSRS